MSGHITERFDHDGMFRHHHASYTGDGYEEGEPIWWGHCEQFGGLKRDHRHTARAAAPPVGPEHAEDCPKRTVGWCNCGAQQEINRLAASPEPTPGLRDVLTLHYVTAIDCDHEAKTDTVRCNCSIWTGTPQPSVGQAVAEWADHVAALLPEPVPLDVERPRLAAALLDAVEEAVNSEALPGNIHHRLEVAYNAVVAEANRA